MLRHGLEYIRKHYGVPAYIGTRVQYKRRFGKIAGYHVDQVRVLWDGDQFSKVYHALDLEYLVEAKKAKPTKRIEYPYFGMRSPWARDNERQNQGQAL